MMSWAGRNSRNSGHVLMVITQQLMKKPQIIHWLTPPCNSYPGKPRGSSDVNLVTFSNATANENWVKKLQRVKAAAAGGAAVPDDPELGLELLGKLSCTVQVQVPSADSVQRPTHRAEQSVQNDEQWLVKGNTFHFWPSLQRFSTAQIFYRENIWQCLLIGCFREQRQGAETAPPLICVKLWSSSRALSSWITSMWSCRKGCFSNFGMDWGKEVSMGWNFHLVRTLPWSSGYLLSFAVLKEQLTRHRCQLVAFVGIRHRYFLVDADPVETTNSLRPDLKFRLHF